MTQWLPSGRLIAAGKSLEYACYGPPPDEAPTLVLLHEGLGCAALWRDFPERLIAATSGQCGVFVYSRAGYGESDPADLPRPLNYMSLEAETVLPEVLDAMKIEQAVLLGHSDGASIAAVYAGTFFDDRLQAVILMAPHFFTENDALLAIEQARQSFDAGELSTRMAKYHRSPENAFRGWNDSWLHPDFKEWNVESVIDSITVPVFAIQGRQDQYGTLRQIDVVTKRCPTLVETMILDECRHSPQFDHPDTVAEAVAKFCARFTTKRLARVLWPKYAYIPGEGERHAEDAFDAIRTTAQAGQSIASLATSSAFQHGLVYLDSGFYWESHEVLEAVWMALPDESDEKRFVQGLIQFANASLKQKMNRPKAALRLCGMAKDLMPDTARKELMGVGVEEYGDKVDVLQESLNLS